MAYVVYVSDDNRRYYVACNNSPGGEYDFDLRVMLLEYIKERHLSLGGGDLGRKNCYGKTVNEAGTSRVRRVYTYAPKAIGILFVSLLM